jgi:hypothetical protein
MITNDQVVRSNTVNFQDASQLISKFVLYASGNCVDKGGYKRKYLEFRIGYMEFCVSVSDFFFEKDIKYQGPSLFDACECYNSL